MFLQNRSFQVKIQGRTHGLTQEIYLQDMDVPDKEELLLYPLYRQIRDRTLMDLT